MSLLENLMDQALSKLEPAERTQLMQTMAEKALATLPIEDRRLLLEHVVDRFMEGLSAEEQSALVREVLPHLLARLLQVGNMSVDEFLWSAIGSLGVMDGKPKPESPSP